MRKLNTEKVRDLIALRGMTVTEFARKIGEQQQTVQKWIAGKRNPKPASLIKIAEQLEVTVPEISLTVFTVSRTKVQQLNLEVDEIAGLWGNLTGDQRKTVLDLIRSIAETNMNRGEK